MYKWYRKWKGGIWYNHQFTEDAGEICSAWIGHTWWARYGKLNRYSIVIKTENYEMKQQTLEQFIEAEGYEKIPFNNLEKRHL